MAEETPRMKAAKYPPPSAPYAVALQLYREHLSNEGMSHLAAWRGGWMAWQQTRWVEVDAAALRQDIYAALSRATYWHETKTIAEWRPWSPDRRKIANVLEALAAVVHLSSDIDAPAWINHVNSAKQSRMISARANVNVTETSAAQVISCNNGLLDVSTRRLHDHTAAFLNVVSAARLPVDAVEPTEWFKFLTSVWGDDEDSIMLLQEYFGYVLSGRMDMQKMLMLHGPIRSGKGTIERVLAALMGGNRNIASPTLASLSTNFGLSPLIGKPLAFITDARLGNIPSHTVVERLLSITGEDWLTIDRKYREPWTGKLPTRFVILTNELPKFRDSSGAIATRLLILKMTNSFLGREDHTLYEKLLPELDGILAWALEGLDRLTRNGHFTEPQSSRDSAALMMDMASPVSAFVRERCVREPDMSVRRDDLYTA
jgi:putative DNA primase/helicase